MSVADTVHWAVLVNQEGQYGLYPAGRPAPRGWSATGFQGAEDACQSYVDEHWTDMRPDSLRRALDASGDERGHARAAVPASRGGV